jgi:hypothetical protein
MICVVAVTLPVVTLFGVGATALLNGTPVNVDSISYLLQLELPPTHSLLTPFMRGWCQPDKSEHPWLALVALWAKERPMTYQDDPNGNLRRNKTETAEPGYTGWIVGGAVALAFILGLFMMTRGTDNSGMATNDTPATSRPATPPTTTGSGSSQPSNPPASVPTTPNAR